jgi:type IV fimbrial biogenesis protein FimT
MRLGAAMLKIDLQDAVAFPARTSDHTAHQCLTRLHMQHNLRLKGAADVLVAELRLAQSESFKCQTGVSLNFRTSGSEWCYGYSINTACDCTQPLVCVMDGVDTVRQHHQYPGVQLLPGVSGNRFSFQPRRGTVTAGNILLTGENGKQLRVVVSGLGRIRICTPSGVSRFAGYPVCS